MLNGHRILIVEDEPLIALDLEAEFRDAGAETIIAATLSEALNAAELEGLTGAVLDLGLNGQSVRGVAGRLSERGIPFVFYSGHEETTTARGWAQAPVILKPAASGQLIDMLIRVMDAKNNIKTG